MQRYNVTYMDCKSRSSLLAGRGCIKRPATDTVPGGGSGASCHVGYRSCFYRSVELGGFSAEPARLAFTASGKSLDPIEAYGDTPNPTQL